MQKHKTYISWLTKRFIFSFLFFATCNISWCSLAKLEDAPVAAAYWRETHYNANNGDFFNKHKVSKTILKAEGIEHVSQLSVTYSQTDKIRVTSLVVTQPDGQSIQLGQQAMDTRLVSGSSHGFTQDRQLSFLLPRLKVGSTVELIFEQFHSGKSDPGKSGIYARFLPSNERIDSVFEKYTSTEPWIVKHENTQDYEIKVSDDRKVVTVRQKAPKYWWLTNELPNSYIRQIPTIAMHTTDDWQVCVDRVISGWNQELAKPLPLKMKEAVCGVENKTPKERVVGLMQYLRDHYRYLGDWREKKRGWLAFPLAEIEKRGYGDCKDFSMALTALLRASGIDAEPALVTRGIACHKILLPSAGVFNHVIVRAKIGDKVWWLDPTNRVFLPGYIMPDIHDRWALVWERSGKVRLTHIPVETADMIQSKVSSICNFDTKGNMKMETNAELHGTVAVDLAAKDYFHGPEKTDLWLCGGEKNPCTIKRTPTQFLVPTPYRLVTNSYIKGAATVRTSKRLLISAPSWVNNVASELRAYLDNRGEADFALSTVSTNHTRTVIHNYRLIKPVKPHIIQSPWIDAQLKWYNSRKDGGCVIEMELKRKVDWLDHQTLTSPEFKAFLEKLETIEEDSTQVIGIIDPTKSLITKKE